MKPDNYYNNSDLHAINAEASDYTVGSETLTLTAGATSVTTTVMAVQDTLDDDAETIVITAEGAEATVTITDDVDAVQRVNAGGFSPAPLQTLRRDARLDSAAVRQALGEARIVTVEEHGRIAAQAVNLPVVPRARAAALALNTVHPRRDEPVAELATEQDDRAATHRVNESRELASCALAAR